MILYGALSASRLRGEPPPDWWAQRLGWLKRRQRPREAMPAKARPARTRIAPRGAKWTPATEHARNMLSEVMRGR